MQEILKMRSYLYDQLLDRRELSGNPEFIYKVALFQAKHGTPGKTEQLMKRLVELAPNGKFYYNYALILARKQKTERSP